MKREDFIYNMTTDFKSKNMNETLKFSDDLNVFCDKCGDIDYQSIYDHVRSIQGKYKSIPKMYKLNNFASKQGLIKSATSNSTIWSKCDKCGAEYSFVSRACPLCGSSCRSTQAYKDGSPALESIVQCQELCYMCPQFKKLQSDDRCAVFGPECQKFGTKWKQYPFQHCNGCSCRPCCMLERRYNGRPDVYKDDVHCKRINEPWLEGNKN